MFKKVMFEKYISQFPKIEKEWYDREPVDKSLKNDMIQWLGNDNNINVIELNDQISLKYFIRSYRAAFASVINSKIDINTIDSELRKVNKIRKKDNKKPRSRVQYINDKLKKDTLKHDLYIRIGDVDLSISSNPSTSHLGNGHVRNIGKYIDIWPMLNLITDCKQENNQKLAELFLNFANSPSKFTRQNLIAINPKFALPEFDSTANYFRNFLTGIALHYIFYESARRVVLTEEEDQFDVQAPQNTPVASSILIVLKALKKGILTELEEVFSPKSKYILITKEGVNSLSKSVTQTTVKNMSLLGINRVKQEYRKKELSPNAIVAHALYPHSDKFDSEETEEYSGENIKISQSK